MKQNIILKLLVSSLIGLLLVPLIMLIFAFIASNTDFAIYNISVIVCMGISSLISGIVAGRIIKQKGILCGFTCGIIISFLFLIFKLAFAGYEEIWLTAIKILVILLFGSFGGVLGVNKNKF
ncbi:MAG: TIGR04086 family membrane protein [Oscillospiraceae bacterium]